MRILGNQVLGAAACGKTRVLPYADRPADYIETKRPIGLVGGRRDIVR